LLFNRFWNWLSDVSVVVVESIGVAVVVVVE
jgi:hypothetical protein